jgi:hypothetical protein
MAPPSIHKEFQMPRKKGSPNKSAAIRDLLSANPQMPAKEVIAAMAAQGMKVSPNLVYLIKAKKGAAKRKQRRVGAARVMGNGVADVASVIRQVRQLAGQVGGMGKLKDLVVVLAE